MPGSTLKTRQRRPSAAPAFATRGQALATVGHELRTPLNGIVGMAELLSGTSLTPEQRSYVEAIRGSGTALASLIDELLDHARMEVGRLDVIDAPFAVVPLVESVVELLAPRAQGKGIEIAASIAGAVPVHIDGDAGRLRQILLNVVGNAVKFTETGGVGVEVSADAGELKIAVVDTGPGVPAARRAAIFEAFEQAAPSTARQFGGTGLGLSIARHLAERMGGSLRLAASGPQGSTFALALPLRPAGGSAVAALPRRSGRALIVADSPFEAPYMAARLREIGMDVALVPDAAAARERLAEKPDLMIVDCAQGDARARGLAQAARKAGVGRCLVLLSPFERRAFGPASMRAFDGWLVKPVRARSLYARLEGAGPASSAIPPARVEVLLAEDNEINALLATRYLERFGARVTRVADGAAAVALVEDAAEGKRPRFDAAFLDIRMPKFNGFEVARRIRALEGRAGAPRLPLIALTADRLDATAARDFDQVLEKPVEFTRIGRVLEACRPVAVRTA